MKAVRVNPSALMIALVLVSVSTFLCRNVAFLTLFWIVVVVPTALWLQLGSSYLRFLATIVLPIAIPLIIVWGYVVAAPPGSPIGTSAEKGVAFACTVSLRLAILGGTFQMLTTLLSRQQMISLMSSAGWSLRNQLLVLGVLTVWADLKHRGRQVVEARIARGLLRKHSRLAYLISLPFILRPLLIWAVRSGLDRSEFWKETGLLQGTSGAFSLPVAKFDWTFQDVMILLISVLWLGVSTYSLII